jgi:hypothetical protein
MTYDQIICVILGAMAVGAKGLIAELCEWGKFEIRKRYQGVRRIGDPVYPHEIDNWRVPIKPKGAPDRPAPPKGGTGQVDA